ncbi:nitroreductase family protein [Dysgonomonas sp. BGC7]|uniref:nitroreductase family protein n=1 Tax=Dysgonomonas sp. BGC7 TaxID=1658008 RepID=UPI000681956B|nr:nitroreductase family protein [Dysgonomonas sp. BGC7]MBD8390341.1 nitroreductase family protein [Dysgonomonas sp. BGC7]
MSNFHELIKKRRSIRKFTEEPISPEDVESILKAALMSPSSKSTNPWQFVLVEDKEILEKLSYCKKSSSKLIAGCALAVVVLADPLSSDVWIEDSSIASIMMQLQAEDLGLGSCWVQVRERYTAEDTPSEEYVRLLLDIPLQLQVLSVIAFGHKAQERSPFDEEKLQWEKIHIGKFNINQLTD